MTFAIVASGVATALGASATTAALVGAGAGFIGSQFNDSGVSSAQGTLNASNTEANALAREQFEYQKQTQAPYQQAGTGALGMITNGLGIAPQVETRDQIRARLGQQRGGRGVSQYSNPIANSQVNTGNLPVTGINDLGQVITGNLNQFPQQFTDVYNSTNIGQQANAQQNQQDSQIRIALGLSPNDNSPEAQARINAYRNIGNVTTNGQNQQLSDADLDAQVEAEYLRQQQANTSATGSAGFGDFNRDFTAADFDVNKDPSAKFRQDEALKALSRTYAGSGNFFSGGALKGITKYSQDFASNEFGNAYDRFNDDRTRRFNRLATVAGIGQTANQATGNASQNYANTVGNNITDTGSANASAQLYGGRQLNNAIQGGVAQLGNQIPRISNYFEQQRLSGYGGTTADPWYG